MVFFSVALAFVLACWTASASEAESSVIMTSARFRFPVLAGDASESVVTVVAFVLDLEERVETAAAVGGLGALFGGMMETLWIRVVRMLVMMSVDGSKEGLKKGS